MNSENDIWVACSEPELAKESVNALQSAGIPPRDIVMLSSEPLAHYGVWSQPRTLMPWIAASGAVVAGIGGFLLASLTQKSYAIHTGGMQVVTLWADGIITYELTMLGAILTTGIVFLISGVLRGRDPFPYELEVSEGKVLVGAVSVPASRRNEIIATLKRFGEIKPGRTSPDSHT